MKTVKLVSISEVKTEKDRTDGKVSRKYYTARFANPANPFGATAQRNVWQSHNSDGTLAFWKTGDPSNAMGFIGKEIEGEIKTIEVKPYEIDGRMVKTTTMVILEGEIEATVLKANGHEASINSQQAAAKEKEIITLN